MKLLALMLTFLFCAANQSAGKDDSGGYRLVSYEEVWTKQLFADGNWINDSKFVNVFSPEGNLLSRTKYLWIDGDWSKFQWSEYQYDDKNNKIEELIYGLRYSQWINHIKLVYEYDKRNLEIRKTEYDWYGDSLHKAFQFRSNYDESGKLIVKYRYDWGEAGWVANFKTTYSYDKSGRKTEELFQTNFQDSTSNIDRTLTEYKGDTTLVTDQGWNNNYWFDATREVSIKNSDNNSEIIISQYPKDSVWINSTQKICKYNADDSLIYKEKLEYKPDSLMSRKRYFYGFNGGRKISELEQIFYVKWRDQYRSGLDTNWGYANKEIITDVKIGFVGNDKTIAGFNYVLNKDADVRIYISNDADKEIMEVFKGKQISDKYNFEFVASNFLGGEYYLVFETSGIKGKIKLPKK